MSMINLMPPDRKQNIMYARRNSSLVRWISGISLAALGLILIAGGGLFYLKQDSSALQKEIDDTKAELVAQNEAATLKRVEEISGNIKLVVDVLSDEVLFSKLLQHIGLVMPSGTILQDLRLTSDLQGGLSLTIGAANYQAGTQAQVNLADPENGIFEKADLVSLSCSAEATDPRYPCTGTIRALFKEDNNPFLFLNKEGQ